MEEAESGALSLEDTGDFASRLAAFSTSASRTGTSVGDSGTDSEDKGVVNAEMEFQNRSNKDCVTNRETSISEEKVSLEQGDKGDQADEERGAFATSETGEEAAEEPPDQKDEMKDGMQKLPEEKVQQVVEAIQDSFLQMLEAGKEDLLDKLDGGKVKQAKKEEKDAACDEQK